MSTDDEPAIVSNSGPLIALASVGLFNLLQQVYGSLAVPHAVYREVTEAGGARPGARELAAARWITRVEVTPPPDPILVDELDDAEAEAITLAVRRGALLLLDEKRGRRIAEIVYRLRIRGTVGTLAVAKRRGLLPAVRPILAALQQGGYYLSNELIERVCRELSTAHHKKVTT
jgi:uncharacterized protein